MLDGLRLFGMGWSWGGFESLIIPIYPERARTVSHWEAGGPCLRLYVGLEDPDDLIADLAEGFARLRRSGCPRRDRPPARAGSARIASGAPSRDDPAAVEHDHAVGEAEHDVHVVLGEQHGDAVALARGPRRAASARARERGAMPAVGSSISSSCGSPASASASSTRLASP